MNQALSNMPTVPTTRYSNYLLPFVLDEQQLARLHEAFSEFAESVTYTIDCTDGLTRQLSLADLRTYENSPQHAIRALQISTPASTVRYARMRLRNNDFENVEVDFAGPEPQVLKLSDAVDDVLLNKKPWYGWIAKHPIWQLGSLLLMAVLLLITFVAAAVALLIRAGKLPPPDMVTVNDLAITLLLTSGFATMYVTILSLLEWFRISLFPAGTFALGQGKKSYRHLEWVRWAVVLSLLAGITGGGVSVLIQAAGPF